MCILLSELAEQNAVPLTFVPTLRQAQRATRCQWLEMVREVSGPAISSFRVRINTLISHGRGSSIGTKVNESPMKTCSVS